VRKESGVRMAPVMRGPRRLVRRAGIAVACAAVISTAWAVLTDVAVADPAGADAPAPPLPVITPSPTNWEPKFPFPFDQMRNQVTEADITAEREMCQWYEAQYDELIHQIDRFNVNLITANGKYEAPGVIERADAVTRNIDQSVAFLAPRAQALTISKDFAGDLYFPLYQGESFYRLWQQLSNVRDGIRGRQPAWFTGPSLQHAMRFGSKIHRSHICD